MKEEKKDTMINMSFISGLMSGTINKFLTHPIDTIKAKIQIKQLTYNSLSNITKNGIIKTSIRVYREEGIKGFYRGVSFACVN